MLYFPTGRVAKLRVAVAIPLAPPRVAEPMLMAAPPPVVGVAKKVTVPVGVVATPEPWSVTVAVKATGVPNVDVVVPWLRVMLLGRNAAGFTVWVRTGDVAWVKVAFPLYTAVMAWPPRASVEVV